MNNTRNMLFASLIFLAFATSPTGAAARTGDFATAGIHEENALSRALDRLRDQMKATAEAQGKQAHPFSNVVLTETDSEAVESQTSTSVTLKSVFTVHMKGGIIGLKKFEVEVKVIGKVTKNDDGTYSTSVSGAVVQSDRQVP